MADKIKTRWEVRTYDVWGNAEDGYEVNDSYSHGEVELDAEVISEIVHMIDGVPTTVYGYGLSDDDIRDALGIKEGVKIEIDGDDVHYSVTIEEDGYPVGEMTCISHVSLSPLRGVDDVVQLPAERIVHQFDHASVVYTCEHSAATGKVMPKLYVQVIDQYGYQRELSVALSREPGDSKDLYWEYHIYRHPGRRHIDKVGEGVAAQFINRFLELCRDYPSLLFNKDGEHAHEPTRPRCEGFVHLAERLHDGWELSVKLLD